MTLNPDLTLLSRRALDACASLAAFTEVPGEITRTFLCAPSRDVTAFLSAWAHELNLSVTLDAAGNLRARRAGPTPDAPTLYLGSHVDTVPNAGAFDGVLGVTLAFAVAQALRGEALPFALELLAFSEEEGVRFGVPFIGSRALTGTLAPLLPLQDAAGVSVLDALRGYGLDPDALPDAQVRGAALGFLEFHIEQGPVLQAAGASVGVVSAIVGQDRVLLDFTGQAAHAGTTPMAHRRDALAAAARFAVAAEDLARATPGLVATVGVLTARPGAINVIPGQAHCTLDLRHEDDGARAQALNEVLSTAGRVAQERGVTLKVTHTMAQAAVPMDAGFREALRAAAAREGLQAPDLVSGAGHDAMILAGRMPAAMLFLRSPNALSHHPDETVHPEDVHAALRVGVGFVRALAGRTGEQP
ncbi:allantoate amidohydrolase (plasmid) [Deinococcus taeanensis]|uniref:allantoate amidohydrolase n=1 Tax=Deinococcus taeanensis TaxID=2737050 RepID=UPI001CDC0244|nr:allantoate amidohydrolase [Deinococcus taeanensis]UBV44973.1 allantoate amidohydrolase [Deinococcus taeanensis]